MTLLGRLRDQALSAQPLPPVWLVLLTFALAVALIVPRRVWPVTRNAVTIAHEGGHAFVALATGRQLSGIRLHADTSGVTVSRGRPTGIGMVLTMFAGYPAPAVLGLGAARLLRSGHADALLVMSVVLLVLLLIQIRNAWGALTVVVTGGALAMAVVYAPSTARAGTGYLLAWFLLVAGFRPVIELWRARRVGQAPDSDADQLARLTGIPGGLWNAMFGAVTGVVLFVGGRWMLGF